MSDLRPPTRARSSLYIVSCVQHIRAVKKLFLGLILVGVVAAAAVALALMSLGFVVKASVEHVGPRLTKVPVRLDSASVSVFSGEGELKGLFVGNPEGYREPSAVEAGEIRVVIKPRSLMADKVIVNEIRLTGPRITWEGDLRDSNLKQILANVKESTRSESGGQAGGQDGEAASRKKLQVDEFVIRDGRVTLSGQLTGGKRATVDLPEIRLVGLGAGPEGITAAGLIEKVLQEVLDRGLPLAAEALSKTGIRIPSEKAGLNEDTSGQLQKIGEGIGGLLQRDK